MKYCIFISSSLSVYWYWTALAFHMGCFTRLNIPNSRMVETPSAWQTPLVLLLACFEVSRRGILISQLLMKFSSAVTVCIGHCVRKIVSVGANFCSLTNFLMNFFWLLIDWYTSRKIHIFMISYIIYQRKILVIPSIRGKSWKREKSVWCYICSWLTNVNQLCFLSLNNVIVAYWHWFCNNVCLIHMQLTRSANMSLPVMPIFVQFFSSDSISGMYSMGKCNNLL